MSTRPRVFCPGGNRTAIYVPAALAASLGWPPGTLLDATLSGTSLHLRPTKEPSP